MYYTFAFIYIRKAQDTPALLQSQYVHSNTTELTGIIMTASPLSHAQWNLVCGNAYIMEIVQPSFLVGAIIGAFIQGPLSDRYVNIYMVS